MAEKIQLTAEVFIDTGKDFRPEDSLTVPYICSLGETVTLDFDLSVFEHSCGFRFDPLLEDSSMVRLEEIALTYEDGETKEIEFSRIKTNSDVDFEPIFVYLHKDPKFFVDEALSLKLKSARVRFQVLELGAGGKGILAGDQEAQRLRKGKGAASRQAGRGHEGNPRSGKGEPEAADRGGGYLFLRNLEAAARREGPSEGDLREGKYSDLPGVGLYRPLHGAFHF